MRATRSVVLLLAGSLLAVSIVSSPLSAQQSTSTSSPVVVSDAQAAALIQRSLLALTGGVPVSDVTLTGTARRIAGSDDESGPATLKATGLGDSRVDLVFPSGNRSEIRNHSAIPLPGAVPKEFPAAVTQTAQPVGAWSGPDGALHGIASHNTMTDAAWFFPAATFSRLVSSQGWVFSYVGSEELNGAQVIHIQAFEPLAATIKAPSGAAALMQHLSQMDIYFDPATSLPVALAFNVHPDGNALLDIPTRVEFSSYQSVNGVQVPFHVQRYLNNSLVLDLQFSSASLNSGLSAASFQIQ
jgi:hypothetical protein